MGKTGYTSLLGVLFGSAFLAGFNENQTNMALVSIMDEYAIDSVTAQWLVTGYMIVSTIVVTCMAFLYNKIPLRKLFFIAALFSFIGSLMGLFAFNFPFLMAARIVQAVGTGIFIPMMMTTIMIVTPKEKLGTFMSIGSCMILFGPASAPVICGIFVTLLGWHSIFIVPIIAIVVLSILGFFFIHNLENHEAHLDIPSVCLSAIALFGLSFGLMELTLDILIAIISLAISIIAIVIFVIRQFRCAHPLINLQPMKRKAFRRCVPLAIVNMMTSFSLSVLLPLYFEGSHGMTSMMAGIIILFPLLANMVATLLAGRILDKYGEWPLIPVGFIAIIIGLSIMAITGPQLSLVPIFIGAIFTYLGVGLCFSPSQTSGLRTLPGEENAHGVTIMSTFIQIAACIGPSMFIGIQTSSQQNALQSITDTALANAQGFSSAVWVAACIAVVGLVIGIVHASIMRKAYSSDD